MEHTHGEILLLGTCTFEPTNLTLRDASGTPCRLRSQSLHVLAELAHARGQVVSHDDLIEAVWPGTTVTDDSLVQCIKDIRAALFDSERRIVKTVIGQGYALNARMVSDKSGSLPTVFVDHFKVTGGSADAEELADRLFEEIIVRLASRVGIIVVSDPAQKSKACYVISGRSSSSEDQARIFVQIERSARGENIHASVEQASGAEIWELPIRIADKIASHLRVFSITNDGLEFLARDDASLSAQELMAKAAWHMTELQREGWYVAQKSLSIAVELEPANPIALAMLASMQTQMIPLIPFNELPQDVGRAFDLSQRAVEHGQSIDYVLRTRGNLRLWCRGDHDGARFDCERALSINPIFHLAHLTIATSEILSGEFKSGSQRLEEMMRRAVIDPQNPFYFSLIALAEVLSGHEEAAIVAAREGYERNPFGSWNALVYAVTALNDSNITSSDSFKRMVQRIDLPAQHFLDLPFTDPGIAEELVTRSRAVGLV